MSIESIKQKLAASSIKDTSWQEKAKWRQENKSWLDISFAIAIKIGSALDANKNSKISPKNQIELAEQLNCSPQYVNKLLKGQENLQIETICKIEKVLGISLIQVPKYEISQKVEVMSTTYLNDSISLGKEATVFQVPSYFTNNFVVPKIEDYINVA